MTTHELIGSIATLGSPAVAHNPLSGDMEITVPVPCAGTQYAVLVAWNRHDAPGLTEVLLDPQPAAHDVAAYLAIVEHAARRCDQRAAIWTADDPLHAGTWRQAATRLRRYAADYAAEAAADRMPQPFPYLATVPGPVSGRPAAMRGDATR